MLLLKNTASFAFIKKGAPGVKFSSVTAAGSFISLDSVANCASFQGVLKMFSTTIPASYLRLV